MHIRSATFQAKSVNEGVELKTPLALPSPRLCCPPDAARRRRLEVAQVSSTEVECAQAAYLPEKALSFLVAAKCALLSCNIHLGQSIDQDASSLLFYSSFINLKCLAVAGECQLWGCFDASLTSKTPFKVFQNFNCKFLTNDKCQRKVEQLCRCSGASASSEPLFAAFSFSIY